MSTTPEQRDAPTQRRDKRPPGGTDLFSSERSFSPPVGRSWDAEKGPVGYFIDFGVKTQDDPTWPPSWLQPFERQIHVATVQWGLGAFERYVDGDGEQWLDAALRAATYLLEHQHGSGPQRGGWQQQVAMPHTYLLEPPWLSAITQGEGASLFARLHRESGEERFREGALEALRPLSVSSSEGGTLAHLDGDPFVEEYPTNPPSYVLNGAIFALWGCFDVGRLLSDEGSAREFERLASALQRNLWRFDTSHWSRYDLYPHLLHNVASAAYHGLHIKQLRVMERIRPGAGFGETADRWDGYRQRRANRALAFSTKVLFRLANPRNERVALRGPWARQPAALRRASRRERVKVPGEILVLAYHAVSPDWEAPLSVTPDHFRAQLEYLVERGYRGATFAEALSAGAADDRVVAVTFDDAYASVASVAAPIMAELGLPGTVFFPTGFVGSAAPMAWAGIDGWLDSPHRDELLPISWEQARELAGGGWEIGSHTRTHPYLTEVSPEQLREELAGSRADVEREIGRPCRSMAFPYGDHDERVVRAAGEAGYEFAGTMPAHLPVIRKLAWPRVGVYHDDTLPVFRLKVSPAIRRLRRSNAWSAARPILRTLRHGRRRAPS